MFPKAKGDVFKNQQSKDIQFTSFKRPNKAENIHI